MAKRMLLDAIHSDETRVVVLDGNRLEEFDYETREKKQLKGNIYLAKVTRVEPSLQAAFVDYGGNRHGFLPFSEIHPDYYRLPIADRQALIAEEAQLKVDTAEEEAAEAGGEGEAEPAEAAAEASGEADVEQLETATSVETVGGDEVEEAARRRAQLLRRYKIQEVIKRRQVILVQVVKEERGTKGAALTTYLSLAGRYCVLMPNTAKGGGISRKITNPADRRRLKQVLAELAIPEGMAVIVRTAGAQRSKTEIKRDYEYLLRLWDEVRQITLESTAPCLIYEEANLIKRAVRDLYSRDMEEILVEGEEGYKAAKRFMRNLTPSHARKVKQYTDPRVPLLHRYQIEAQLDNIHNPSVQLKSGGYIVLNQTEALVAIDVNSGRATRERHIEETALKTNLEAAEEIARQVKLRDLAGLIVIDFIDMDTARNAREVEQRLKEAMRQDRARIQLGRISPFGLLELSRQRLRPSLHETSTEVCRTCGGSGFVRSPESTGLHVLRGLEEEGIKRGGGELQLMVPSAVALYLVNHKREHLHEIEQRYGLRVFIDLDDRLVPPAYRLDRLSTTPRAAAVEAVEEAPAAAEAAEAAEEGAKKGRRRRPHRRRGEAAPAEEAAAEPAEAAAEAGEPEEAPTAEDEAKARRRRRRGKRGGRRRARRREIAPEEEVSGEADEAAGAEGEPPAEAATTAEPSGEAAAAAAAPEPEPTEAGEEAAEAKPKRKRASRRTASPRRGKRAAPQAVAEPGPTTPASEPAPAAGPEAAEQGSAAQTGTAGQAPPTAEPAAAEEVEKTPKRRRAGRDTRGRRSRKQQAAATEASGEEAEQRHETPASASPLERGNGNGHNETAESDRQPEPVEESETAAAGKPEQRGERTQRPRRRGWWSRMLS